MKKILYCLLLLAIGVVVYLFVRPSQPMQVVSVTTEAIPVDSTADAIQDADYIAYLAPTKADLEREMGVKLGYAPEALWVGGNECPLVNWASDALLDAAREVYPGKVDLAIVNVGGIRNVWPAGDITVGSVFEIMPFDNRLVVLTLTGEDILTLCQSFAKYGGQGVAGMRVTIIDNRLANVTIGGKAVNPKATYKVATSDYLSGGADHMEALTNHTDKWDSGLKIRDLYIQTVQKQGTVRAAVDGRMTIKP